MGFTLSFKILSKSTVPTLGFRKVEISLDKVSPKSLYNNLDIGPLILLLIPNFLKSLLSSIDFFIFTNFLGLLIFSLGTIFLNSFKILFLTVGLKLYIAVLNTSFNILGINPISPILLKPVLSLCDLPPMVNFSPAPKISFLKSSLN